MTSERSVRSSREPGRPDRPAARLLNVARAVSQVGMIDAAHLAYAADLKESMPRR